MLAGLAPENVVNCRMNHFFVLYYLTVLVSKETIFRRLGKYPPPATPTSVNSC